MSGPQIRRGTELRLYNEHVSKVQSVGAKIKNDAPLMPLGVYLNDAKFLADIHTLRQVERDNRDLLKNINIIYRTKGKTECQLEKYTRQKTLYAKEIEGAEKMRKRNAEFLKKLDSKNVKSRYNQEDMIKDWKRILKIMKFSAKYPEFYKKKTSTLNTWSLYPKNIIKDTKLHDICYFDLKIGDLPKPSRLEIELYNDVVPITSENFSKLCNGFSGLTYKNSVLHRIVPDLLCMGGDIINHSGTGGMSIYGPSFPDENFILKHNGPGVIAMYSSEPDKNNSQFLITFTKLTTLNRKHVVFGRVRSSPKLFDLIGSCGSKSGRPLDVVRIVDCGVSRKASS